MSQPSSLPSQKRKLENGDAYKPTTDEAMDAFLLMEEGPDLFSHKFRFLRLDHSGLTPKDKKKLRQLVEGTIPAEWTECMSAGTKMNYVLGEDYSYFRKMLDAVADHDEKQKSEPDPLTWVETLSEIASNVNVKANIIVSRQLE